MIPLEELVLESRREPIETEITEHQACAVNRRVSAARSSLARDGSVQCENGTTRGDKSCDSDISGIILSLIYEEAPNHDWDHLRALAQRLHREGDVL